MINHLVEELHHKLERGVRGAAAQRRELALPPTRGVLLLFDGDFLQGMCMCQSSLVRYSFHSTDVLAYSDTV